MIYATRPHEVTAQDAGMVRTTGSAAWVEGPCVAPSQPAGNGAPGSVRGPAGAAHAGHAAEIVRRTAKQWGMKP